MKHLLSMFIVLLTITTTIAQEVKIPEIPARKFEGVRPLEGIGYYTFYFDERAKKGYRDFVLKIFDYDLKELKTTKVNLPKHVALINGVYNGKDILLGFIDVKKKKTTYVTFDNKGNKIKERYDDIKNKLILSDQQYQPKIFAGNESFFIVKMIKEKKYGFQVEKVNNNLKSQWTKSFIPKKGLVIPVSSISENGILAITSIQYPSLMSRKKYDTHLSVFDTKSGNSLYATQLNTESKFPIPSSATVDTDGSVILGGMYYNGPVAKKKNSDGVFMVKYARSGKQEFFKTTTWASGLKDALNAELKKSIISAKPMVLFHDIETTPNGYRVIGESFKKSVDALQMGLALMAGGGVNIQMKFTTLDFTIFDFSKTGEVENVSFIKKEPRSIDLEDFLGDNVSSTLSNPMAIAMLMKQYNFFGYRFTTEDANGEDVILFYNNPSNGTVSTGKPYFGIAKVANPEDVTRYDIYGKDSNFSKGRKRIGIVKNKKGKILIYNHDKSDKELTMWISKF